MSLSDEQWLFLIDLSILINYARLNGFKLTGGELKRTEYQQAEYLRTGKSKTMNSNHLKSLAVDLNIFKDGRLLKDNDIETMRQLGNYWESLNAKNMWGGNYPIHFNSSFVDYPHFERRA